MWRMKTAYAKVKITVVCYLHLFKIIYSCMLARMCYIASIRADRLNGFSYFDKGIYLLILL